MPTHYQGPGAETQALDAYIKLVRSANVLLGLVERQAAEEGITHSQFGVLEALLHLGPLSQRDLGRKLLISGGNVSVVVGNLEARDLVNRRRRADDNRVVVVSLSAKGRRLIKRLFPRVAKAVALRMAVLDAAEQRALGDLTRKLGLGVDCLNSND